MASNPERVFLPCLPSAGIKGMCYHTQHNKNILKSYRFSHLVKGQISCQGICGSWWTHFHLAPRTYKGSWGTATVPVCFLTLPSLIIGWNTTQEGPPAELTPWSEGPYLQCSRLDASKSSHGGETDPASHTLGTSHSSPQKYSWLNSIHHFMYF